jgi:hypothetical protein
MRVEETQIPSLRLAFQDLCAIVAGQHVWRLEPIQRCSLFLIPLSRQNEVSQHDYHLVQQYSNLYIFEVPLFCGHCEHYILLLTSDTCWLLKNTYQQLLLIALIFL